MPHPPTASLLLASLVRVAEVISPAHATAVARYALPFVDMDTESPEFAQIISTIAMSLVAEIDVAISALGMAGVEGAEMALLPFTKRDTEIVQFREESSKVFGGIRMENGFFSGPNGGNDDFWP